MSFKNLIKGRNILCIITFIVSFYLVNNFVWLKLNTYPSGPDEPYHLTASLKIFKAITTAVTSNNIMNIFAPPPFVNTGHWPPFFHISSAILNIFLGTSYISSIMVNIVYFLILLFSIYFTGLKLFNKNTGISAVILISMYPMVFRYSRIFGPDFALLAMVCLSICLLLYTEHFRNRKFSILFGFSLGLGMLTKWTFVLFLMGPLIFIFFNSFLTKIKQEFYLKQRVLNFILSLIIAVVISLFWYSPAFFVVIKRSTIFLSSMFFYLSEPNAELIPGRLIRLDKFLSYPFFLVNEGISLLFFTFFLIILFFYLLRAKNRLFLILWFIFPYLILSLPLSKEGRFMLPALPAIALISASGFQNIGSKKMRYFFCCAMISLGLLQFFDISYNFYRNGESLCFQTPIGALHIPYFPTTEHHEWSYGPPLKKDWKIHKIADEIIKYYKYAPDFSSPIIGIICEDDYINKIFGYPYIINYYLAQRNNKIDFIVMNLNKIEDTLNFITKLSEIDCIVFISKNSSWPRYDDLNKIFNEFLSEWEKELPYFRYYWLGSLPEGNIDSYFIQHANKGLKDFLDNKDKIFKSISKIELIDNYSANIYAKKYNYSFKEGFLNISFLGRQVYLSYSNKELTPIGIRMSFKYKNKGYGFSESGWRVGIVTDNKLEAIARWQDLPGLTQIWKFEIINDKEVKCEVGLRSERGTENEKNIDIHDLDAARIELFLNTEYKHWLSVRKEGDFRNVEKGGSILRDATTKFIGVLKNKKANNMCVGVSFALGEVPFYSLAQIHYTNYERQLIYWADLKEKFSELKDGNYDIFSTNIKLIKSSGKLKEFVEEQTKKDIQRWNNLESKYSLNKDNLKIFLDFGQGRIYWRDQEITDGFGLYTSILADGIWHDSQNVLWNIEKIDNFTLLARGRWIDLPLAQVWEIKLADNGLIKWNIKLDVFEKIRLEAVQTNVMLNQNYKADQLKMLGTNLKNSSLPDRIKFILKDNTSICHRKAFAKANFLNSKAGVFTYYDILNKYLQPGIYENYFIGEINIKE